MAALPFKKLSSGFGNLNDLTSIQPNNLVTSRNFTILLKAQHIQCNFNLQSGFISFLTCEERFITTNIHGYKLQLAGFHPSWRDKSFFFQTGFDSVQLR